jgi:hypothetical protein
MTGDGGTPRGEDVDVVVGDPDGVPEHYVLVDQASLVEPGHRGPAVLAQGEGFLDGRLQTVHVNGNLAQPVGRLLGAGEERLRHRLGPARAQEDARVVGVELPIEVIEELEVVALHARAVQIHQRLGEGAQVDGQRGEEGLRVEHQLVDVPYPGREGEADTALQIGADGTLALVERMRPLGVEAHVVNGRAAAPHVTHHAEGRRQLGVERRHDRPVEEIVLQVVVEHTLLDRRNRPTVAVGIDEPGQEQLLAVADHARLPMGLPQGGPVPDLADEAVRHAYRRIGKHPRLRRTREHIFATQQQFHG